MIFFPGEMRPLIELRDSFHFKVLFSRYKHKYGIPVLDDEQSFKFLMKMKGNEDEKEFGGDSLN